MFDNSGRSRKRRNASIHHCCVLKLLLLLARLCVAFSPQKPSLLLIQLYNNVGSEHDKSSHSIKIFESCVARAALLLFLSHFDDITTISREGKPPFCHDRPHFPTANELEKKKKGEQHQKTNLQFTPPVFPLSPSAFISYGLTPKFPPLNFRPKKHREPHLLLSETTITHLMNQPKRLRPGHREQTKRKTHHIPYHHQL